MSIAIRRADRGDIPALLALDSYLPANPSREAEIRDWVAGGECFVAEVAGQPAGYAAVRDIFFSQPMIDILMIAAKHRRSGVGRALVRFLCGRCQAEKIWTSTNQSNLPMQALLLSEGFTYAGLVEGLTEGDPELFYYKRL